MEQTPDLNAALRQIAHDINGELFVIRGHAELGQTKAPHIQEMQRHMSTIIEHCDQMLALTQQLKNLHTSAFDFPDTNAPTSTPTASQPT